MTARRLFGVCLLSAGFLSGFLTALRAGETPPSGGIEATLSTRIGYDTNPVASHGSGAVVLGGADALTFSAGANLATTFGTAAGPRFAKLSYTVEGNFFDGWSEEQFTTHRLGLATVLKPTGWKLSLDAASLWVDGSRDTLASIAGCNANATTLWRERRAQWQHRAKLAAEHALDARWLVRAAATVLDYDYQTHVASGRIAFADRRDAWAGADLGYRQSPGSLWLAGVRVGRQDQDTVPLPGGEFDYSSRYLRAVLGWEGKLAESTTFSLLAGPDFRHFDGNVDARVFSGRNRTSLWLESSLATKLAPGWTLTGKASRWVWLSSTGKSAYTDTAADIALSHPLDAQTTLRLTGKVHGCAYFPAVRDDWEGLVGVGGTRKLSERAQLTFDVLYHAGWNGLGWLPEREFSRFVLNFGGSIRL